MNATPTRIGSTATPAIQAPVCPRAAQAAPDSTLGPVLEAATSTVDLISDAARLAYDSSLKDAASVGAALGAAVDAVEDTYESAVRTAHGLASSVVDTVEEACDAVADSVERAYGTAATGIEAAVDTVGDGLAVAADTVDNALGAVAGYAVGGLKMAGAVLNLQA